MKLPHEVRSPLGGTDIFRAWNTAGLEVNVMQLEAVAALPGMSGDIRDVVERKLTRTRRKLERIQKGQRHFQA